MKTMILLFSILCFTSSCKKEPMKQEPIVENSNHQSEVVWSFDMKVSGGLATLNYIYKDVIIQGHGVGSQQMKIWAFSLDSGNVIWESEVLPCRAPHNLEEVYFYNGKMLVLSSDKIIIINLDNGSSLKFVKLPSDITAGFRFRDDKMYISMNDDQDDYSRIVTFDINTGSIEEVMRIERKYLDNYRPVLTPPGFWKHPSGDEIILMGNRSSGGSLNQAKYDRYDYMAYNVTADSMLWFKKGVLGKRGSISSPLVMGDRVVFYVEREVVCLNALTGELEWEHLRHSSDNFSAYKTANITAWNHIVIAKPDSWHMYGIDNQTGKEVWSNAQTTTMPYAVRVVNDKIWMASGGVCCYDARTGRTLIDAWRYKNQGSYISPIAVDEKTGYIYTVASGVVMCIDANKLTNMGN